MTYLDNAATTLQKPRSVTRNVLWAMQNLGSPGRGGHAYAMQAAQTAFRCREEAARLFGVSEPDRVILTFNATHGLNIAINTLVHQGDRVIVSGYEHNSVMRPLNEKHARIEVAASPLFSHEAAVAAFEEKLEMPADAVILNHVSNVFGFILPVEEIANLCHQRGVPLILDASQSAGTLPVNLTALGAAFIAMPGHKGLYGPQGTGLLLCGIDAEPLLCGGTGSDSASRDMPTFLPDRLEAGTHNMPGVAGLLAGLAYVNRVGTETILNHERRLMAQMAAGLATMDHVTVYASEDPELQTGVLAFNVRGVSSEEAGRLLAERGIAVRAGLHCSPLAHRTAGTFPDGAVRASVSAMTGQNDVANLLKAVHSLQKLP